MQSKTADIAPSAATIRVVVHDVIHKTGITLYCIAVRGMQRKTSEEDGAKTALNM